MTGLYELPAQTRARAPLALMLGLCVVVIAVVAAVNYRVDPVGLFDDGRLARDAARNMVEGRAIAGSNLDDRQLHRAYVMAAPKAPETLVLGSSRMMAIGSALLGNGSVYNASVSSATLPDFLAVTELFLAVDKKPKRVLIGLDTWLLDARSRNTRWRTLASDYAAMRERLGLPAREIEAASPWSRIKALVGLSMTLESLGVLRADGLRAITGRVVGRIRIVPAGDTESAAKLPDGSLQYAGDFRNRGAASIRAAAAIDGRQLVTDSLRGGQFEPEARVTFAALVRHLKEQGIEVVFVLPPFHPATFAWVEKRSEERFLSTLEVRYRTLAKQVGVPVIGSYNPVRAGCSASQFLDGVHPSVACMRSLMAAARREGR